ncbi:MAG: ABC transporter permease [Acidimicrobiales bacterium]|nr:ABC transporter permease [Acidimicrobiia bacterium]NNC80951.1 ABC transporter permease [Acidimicrobiales bacterium]RZV47666.1 MAG: ABC transporter permease [Acidimicrobiales bacterium]
MAETTAHDIAVEAPAEADTGQSVSSRLGLGFWLSVVWLIIVAGLALLAPWLPIADPNETAVGGRLEGPRSGLWFGSDATGRDVFSLTIWGARISLLVGFIAILVGFLVGGTLGILSGYFRGRFDSIVSFIFVTLLSFPALILAILITTLLGRTVFWVALSLGILAIAPVGRLARAQTLVFAERDFVTAARVLGASHRRIIVHELLPNVVIPMSALALLGMGIAVVAEGTLAFLGISVEDGLSWGKQIFLAASRRSELQDGPHAAFFPIGVVFLTVLSLNYAGDRLREVFDAKELVL